MTMNEGHNYQELMKILTSSLKLFKHCHKKNYRDSDLIGDILSLDLKNIEGVQEYLSFIMEQDIFYSLYPSLISLLPLEHQSSCISNESTDNSCLKELICEENQEVNIKVIDEITGKEKTYCLPQDILTQCMKYFQQILNNGQCFDEMDITIHCDIEVFDWLYQWTLHHGNTSMVPLMSNDNILKILTSAEYLEMEELITSCLEYIKNNIVPIYAESPKIVSLNDKLFSRLSQQFHHDDIESLPPTLEKLKSRLYNKAIHLMALKTATGSRGYFSSLQDTYLCQNCKQFISMMFEHQIPCTHSQQHVKSTDWDWTDFIKTLKCKLGSWRNVYWYIWGVMHHFKCENCEQVFTASEYKWCLNHKQHIDFSFSELFLSASYSCCGKKINNRRWPPCLEGCSIVNHRIGEECQSFVELLKYEHLICKPPPDSVDKMKQQMRISLKKPTKLQELVKLDRNSVESRLTCMSQYILEDKLSSGESVSSSGEEDGGDNSNTQTADDNKIDERKFTSNKRSVTMRRTGRPIKTIRSMTWNQLVSTRRNQDNQREFENKFFCLFDTHNDKKSDNVAKKELNYGSYFDIYLNWKEKYKNKCYKVKNKSK